jgi:7-cyano-7-deazaguanine synthase
MRTKVLLSSGGMDSFLLAHEPELQGATHLFVDVGQQYAAKELEAATYVAKSVDATFVAVKATNLAVFEHKATGIIPFRNAELILCAAQLGEDIYLGVIADEVNSDKSPEFLAAMKAVLDISHRGQYWTEGRTFNMLTPFRALTKTQLVQRYLKLGGSLTHLLKSVSCYSAEGVHCGQCSSCFKRWVALSNALDTDATVYEVYVRHPAKWQTKQYWADRLAGYPTNRVDETMRALRLYERQRRWTDDA